MTRSEELHPCAASRRLRCSLNRIRQTIYISCSDTFKVTADTYTQAVTPVKRDAQARIAKLIMADGSASKAITPTLQ